MRNLSVPAALLLTGLNSSAEAGSDHCDTFNRSITFEVQAPEEHGGLNVSRVIPNHSGDVRAALGDIDPRSLWLVHDSQGPGSEELLVAKVNHDGDSHVGLGTFELDLEGTKSGSGWTVLGDSVVICRGEISNSKVQASLKLASR